MNQTVLLGIVKEEPVIKQTSSGLVLGNMLVEVDKTYTNSDGNIDKDVFCITMWRQMAEEAKKNAKVGKYIVIKCHLNSNNYLKDDGSIIYRNEIIADKMFYIN